MGKVLVVDDHEWICRMLARQLQKKGSKVIIAYSGKEAIDVLQKEKVDLILLDQMMPDMDGMETFKKMGRELEGRRKPPVIMITAHGSLELAVAFMKAGGDDFLQKPIDMDILHVKMAQVFERNKIKQEYLIQKEKIKNLELLRKVSITLSHEVNNQLQVISSAVWGLQNKGLSENGFVRIKGAILYIEDVVKKIKELKELKDVEYVGSEKMIDIG